MHPRSDARGDGAAARSLARALARIRGHGNREVAEAYLRVRDEVEGTSVFTRCNDAHALAGLHAQLEGPFAAATREELLSWAAWLEASFAATSVEVRKASIRRFYRYLSSPDDYMDPRLRERLDPLPCAAWISFGRNWRQMPHEQVLREDDVLALVRAAEHPRDAALVATLYESGARLAEFLALDVRHVEQDELGARVTIPVSKTQPRRLRLVLAAPALRRHLEAHPNPEPDAPLWYSLDSRLPYKHGRLARKSLGGVLLAAAQRAGVRKPCHPHAFRHARATVLGRILTEAELRQFMGWSASSPMPGLYIHFAGGESEDKLLAYYGVRAQRRPALHAWAQSRA